ncbi:TPA: hypothetical protein ACXNQV_002142 [Stenotrophomonas maltophilia]
MLAEIKVAIDSLKLGTDIVRGVYAAQNALSEAELKLKMADLIVMLADARVALVSANDRVTESQAEVETLRAMLETRCEVVQHLDAVYETDDAGGPTGSPYCIGCYESSFRLRHLTRVMKGVFLAEMRCPHCSNTYSAAHAPILG